ncbi:MAG: tetratricopeptide repeat protein [Bacteroidales bacterium]|nr:tetratricopeptide repeat protein [Bacteroidales bacterium]
MKTRFLMIIMVALTVGFTACRQEARSLNEAETCYQEGLELKAAKNAEAAAEAFSNALLAINRCDASKTEVKHLKALIEDNLGAMYWKHGLSDEALELHLDAVTLSRELNDTTLLMKALRNCGRVMGSLQRIQEAQAFYGESLNLAESINDSAFVNELLMETGHDLYLESGDYPQAITNATRALSNGANPSFCHLVIGLSHYYQSQDSLAIMHLQEATQSPKPSVRMSAYQGLCQLYQYAGDYPKALECHELYTENMMQDSHDFSRQEMERIKAEYDLKLQKQNIEAEHRLKNVFLYLILGGLIAYLCVVLLLLRQKTLNAKLKTEEMKSQLELALKKNKVYVTALALTEQITSSTLDFNLSEAEWNDFVELVDALHDGFTQRLLAQYPSLNDGDLQICCLAKQGFSNQVISILLNLQTASYARRKSRIKQEKMNGLQDERSFEEIIDSL